jgi:hypothetical protein
LASAHVDERKRNARSHWGIEAAVSCGLVRQTMTRNGRRLRSAPTLSFMDFLPSGGMPRWAFAKAPEACRPPLYRLAIQQLSLRQAQPFNSVCHIVGSDLQDKVVLRKSSSAWHWKLSSPSCRRALCEGDQLANVEAGRDTLVVSIEL